MEMALTHIQQTLNHPLTLTQRVAIIEQCAVNIEREFYVIGQHLCAIRDGRLYEEEGYFSFQEFCEKRIGRSYERARQLIQAYQAVEKNTTTVGEFSTVENEYQARRLIQEQKAESKNAYISVPTNLDDDEWDEEETAEDITAEDIYEEDSPEYQYGSDYAIAVNAQHAGFAVALPVPETYGLPTETEVKIVDLPLVETGTTDFRVHVPEAPKPHVAHNSGNNEWYTPEEYIQAAITVMGEINLDPASSPIANKIVKAKKFYTVEDDGLSKAWKGNVWMNPPYAGELIGKFTAKLCAHFRDNEITDAIVLVNNATETTWFQEMAICASAICFPKGRIKYWRPEGDTSAPLQGQAFFYFGKKSEKFLKVFSTFGLVVFL